GDEPANLDPRPRLRHGRGPAAQGHRPEAAGPQPPRRAHGQPDQREPPGPGPAQGRPGEGHPALRRRGGATARPGQPPRAGVPGRLARPGEAAPIRTPGSPMDTKRERRTLVEAVVASTVGTTIEWYDFFLYGTAAALVFRPLFFPEQSVALGQILSFLTFTVGFVARPLGGVIFGYLGDRVGRKSTLVAT